MYALEKCSPTQYFALRVYYLISTTTATSNMENQIKSSRKSFVVRRLNDCRTLCVQAFCKSLTLTQTGDIRAEKKCALLSSFVFE